MGELVEEEPAHMIQGGGGPGECDVVTSRTHLFVMEHTMSTFRNL